MSTPKKAAAAEENWDSYGAHKTTEAAISTAELVSAAWGPGNDGGLVLEYISPNGRELIVDVGPTGEIVSVNFEVPSKNPSPMPDPDGDPLEIPAFLRRT